MRGTPVHEEYRTFFWRGAPVWSALGEGLAPWAAIARRFRSPFVSLDVARREDGVLRVVESGDGGVSGLPVHCDPDHFYAALAAAIRHDPWTSGRSPAPPTAEDGAAAGVVVLADQVVAVA